mgnify:CR=1 FL=1
MSHAFMFMSGVFMTLFSIEWLDRQYASAVSSLAVSLGLAAGAWAVRQ